MQSKLFPIILSIAYLLSSVHTQTDPLPVQLTPSTETYGPDGPWQAVTVFVGDPKQKIDLYPGGVYESTVFVTGICDDITLRPCASGGVYDPDRSDTLDDTSIEIDFDADWTSGAMYQPGKAQPVLEQVTIDDRNQVVTNLSIDLVSELETIYPEGSRYPVQVGVG